MKHVIFDSANLFHRARHSALAKSRDAQDVNDRTIVYTFFTGIRSLLATLKPDVVWFVMEGRPTARLNMASEYKATRAHAEDPGFQTQVRIIKSLLLEACQVKVVQHPDFEADDVIAHLANELRGDGFEITVVSTDTDFMQLHADIELYNPIRKAYVDRHVKPELYPVFKALTGDKADNIEGFRGIGPKRAGELVESTDKLKEFLSTPENAEKFDRNVSLVRFHDLYENNAQAGIVWQAGVGDEDKLRSKFQEFEFKLAGDDKKWNSWFKPFESLVGVARL